MNYSIRKYFYRNLIFVFVLLVALFNQKVSAQSVTSTKDFAIKGFHLDLRIQVMKMTALKKLATRLKKDGYNTLIMEYEATYPYEKHPLISNRYAYTKAQIVDFVSYCNHLGIDVIPLQQSFGHVEYILRNNRYAQLREDQKDLSQVCPSQVELNKALFTDLFTEIASTHPSKYIHIGCDETHLLGHCPICKAKLQTESISKLYVDHVKMLCDIVIKLGKIPVIWADIALKYPEALQYLPKQTVFVDWNYGWNLDMFGNHEKLMQSGFEIWGAASMRSHPDNFFLTMWQKHFNNIHDFVPQSRNLGYKGMIMTSWSTSGGYEPVSESGTDIVDLIPIRRVYPITAFNILIDAFAASLKTAQPLDIEQFIIKYCKDNYGFDKQMSLKFWSALKAAPYEVSNNKVKGPITLKQLADSAAWSARQLVALSPKKNKDEYAQYVLAANIRLQYLNFQLIEADANTPGFTKSKAPKLIGRLEKVLTAMKALNVNFIRLNQSTFYVSELAKDNALHIAKMQILYDRLNKNR